MSDDPVLLDVDGRGVATLTLNRPQRHNAFDDGMIADLQRALDRFGASGGMRDEVRVVVLAAGGRSFSAGADLDWMRRVADYDHAANLRDARALASMLKTLYELPQPTIARVQGSAFGGAVGLISCCDLAVAAEDAGFSLSEVKIGLLPATISPYVVRALGPRAAARYSMTGERFDAATARELGLVSEVVSAENLERALAALVDTLLGNGPEAVRGAKQLMREVSERPLDTALIERTCEQIAAVRGSPEGREGLAAFLDKRAPRWRGD